MKRKSWHIGPFLLCNKSVEDKLERGKKSTINEHECLKWLESKPRGSVIYISFGSLVNVTISQLHDIAMALEACDVNFIWVIKNYQEMTIQEGFEARMNLKGKWLIIKGWAPQVLILDHELVGGFVTQYGWNSVLKGVSAGVAMVAWPVMTEQFYNAKLVIDILQIPVSVGDVVWSLDSTCEGVNREAIKRTLERVMGGEEAEDMRIRSRDLKEKANASVGKDESSYSD